jgi:hypothetical protein
VSWKTEVQRNGYVIQKLTINQRQIHSSYLLQNYFPTVMVYKTFVWDQKRLSFIFPFFFSLPLTLPQMFILFIYPCIYLPRIYWEPSVCCMLSRCGSVEVNQRGKSYSHRAWILGVYIEKELSFLCLSLGLTWMYACLSAFYVYIYIIRDSYWK